MHVYLSQNDRAKKNGLQNGSVKTKGLPDGVALTIDLIRAQIEGLPRLFEFWEGTGKAVLYTLWTVTMRLKGIFNSCRT